MAWASKKQYAIMMSSEEGEKLASQMKDLSQDEFNKRFSELLGKQSGESEKTTKKGSKEPPKKSLKEEWLEKLNVEYEYYKKNGDYDEAYTILSLIANIESDITDFENEEVDFDEWVEQSIRDGNAYAKDETILNGIKVEAIKDKTESVNLESMDMLKSSEIDLSMAGSDFDGDLMIRRSPYGKSYYIVREYDDNIDWGTKPVDSLRISDHWTFESRNAMHTLLTDPKNILGKKGKYIDNVVIEGKKQMLVAQFNGDEYELVGVLDDDIHEFYNEITWDDEDNTFESHKLKIRI
jgi:hypothetical protein